MERKKWFNQRVNLSGTCADARPPTCLHHQSKARVFLTRGQDGLKSLTWETMKIWPCDLLLILFHTWLNLTKISSIPTFWQRFLKIRPKTWPLECKQVFSKIWPCDLFTPTNPCMILSEITKQTSWPSFMKIGQKMWPLECKQDSPKIWPSVLKQIDSGKEIKEVLLLVSTVKGDDLKKVKLWSKNSLRLSWNFQKLFTKNIIVYNWPEHYLALYNLSKQCQQNIPFNIFYYLPFTCISYGRKQYTIPFESLLSMSCKWLGFSTYILQKCELSNW